MAAKVESGDGSGMSTAPETDKVLFQQDDFPSNLLHNFKDIKSQEQLCDVTLLVGGAGRLFRAHRLVLAAVSPVFRAMFTTDMAEAKQEQIQFPEMDARAFEELLHFAYSGQVRMSQGSAVSLMATAAFLQINPVVELCGRFFQSQLQVGNVFKIRQLAERFNCCTLMEAADRFIQRYFVLLSKTDDFRYLSQELLTAILTKDDLFVSSEQQVFQALMCWVEVDPGPRGEQLGALLPCVRLPLLAPEALADCIQTHPLIQNSPQCHKLLNAALVYKFIPSRRPLLQPFQTKPRMDAPGLIFVVGGHDKDERALSSVEVYDPLIDRWSSIQPMKTARAYAATAIMDGLLYAIGGYDDFESFQSVEVFDPRSGLWEEVVSLNEGRSGVCSAIVDNRLYICGGFGEDNSVSSVEVLDGGRWVLTSPMHHGREGAGVAVLDGKIYMMGGYDGEEALDSVECLDLETMQWTMVQPMRKPRSGLGACTLNSCLFVCGGFDQQDRLLRSVEMYEPSKDEWVEVASMNLERSDVTVVSNCGTLYAIGGNDGSGPLSSMEMFNLEEGVWRLGLSFQTAREGASGIVVPVRPEDLQS